MERFIRIGIAGLLVLSLCGCSTGHHAARNSVDNDSGEIEGNRFLLGDCYLDETGLVYYFYEYEVAAYASGMPSVRIPYEELEWKIPLKNRIN